MKFLLVLSLVFSAAFDACIASSLFESMQIEETSNCYIQEKVASETEDHESHEHTDHDYCQQCHTCQHLISVRVSQNIFSLDSSNQETPYQFYIPSTFIKSLKRPPKV